jgi:hypothetical protein
MTGDHHARMAGRATLLVRAADEILGTHSCRWPPDTCIGAGRDPVAKIDRSQRDRGALAPSAVSDAGVEQPVGDVVQNPCVFDEGASVSETGALPNGPGVRQ